MKNSLVQKIAVWTFDLLINIVIIFGLVVIIQTWIIAPFNVSGSSMCDNLNVINGDRQSGEGEKIIINDAAYLFGPPERGDIVVFKLDNNETGEGKYFIKRIIGLPGETVELKLGEVYVKTVGASESVKLEEPYLNESNQSNTKAFSGISEFKVPSGKYFVMGDNRLLSTDSRSCFGVYNCSEDPSKSFIPEEIIRGKAWIVWWPIDSWRTVHNSQYPELAN